jgi:hypothetical protein
MNIFIPTPPPTYNPSAFATIFDTLKRALTFAVSSDEAVAGVLLQSPDGSVYKLTVDNAGNLVTTAVPLGSR